MLGHSAANAAIACDYNEARHSSHGLKVAHQQGSSGIRTMGARFKKLVKKVVQKTAALFLQPARKADGRSLKPSTQKLHLVVDARTAPPADSRLAPRSLLDLALTRATKLGQETGVLQARLYGLNTTVAFLTEQRNQALAQARAAQRQLEALAAERNEEDIFVCAADLFTEETCADCDEGPASDLQEASVPAAAPADLPASGFNADLFPLAGSSHISPTAATSDAPAAEEAPATAPEDVFDTQETAQNPPVAPTDPAPFNPMMAALLPGLFPASPAPALATSAATAADNPTAALQVASETPAAAQHAPVEPTDSAPLNTLLAMLLPAPETLASPTATDIQESSAAPTPADPLANLPPARAPALPPALMPAELFPVASAVPPFQHQPSAPTAPQQQAMAPLPFPNFGAFFMSPAAEQLPPSGSALPNASSSAAGAEAALQASELPTPSVEPAVLDAPAPHPFGHMAAFFSTPPTTLPSSSTALPEAAATGPNSLEAPATPVEPAAEVALAPPPSASLPKGLFPTPTPAAQPPSPPQEAAVAPHPFACFPGGLFPSPAANPPSSAEEEAAEAPTASTAEPPCTPSAPANTPDGTAGGQDPWQKYADIFDGGSDEEAGTAEPDLAELQQQLDCLRWQKRQLERKMMSFMQTPTIDASEVAIATRWVEKEGGAVEAVPAQLGRGGFGVVYEAFHEQFGPVAYKKLKAGKEAEELAGEADTMARLPRHRNVMPLLARVVDMEGQLRGLLMPLCQAGTAVSLLRPNVPAAERLDAAEEYARALAFLHSHGTLHGDVKLENLMLGGGPGGRGPALVADFGVAGTIDEATGKARLRGFTRHLCSPELHAMSAAAKAARDAAQEAGVPEDALPDLPAMCVGPEEDVWQLGLALLSLATRDCKVVRGSGPHGRLTEAELEAALQRTDACPLLMGAARMCLRADGAQRPSMQAVAAHLRAVRAGGDGLQAAVGAELTGENIDIDWGACSTGDTSGSSSSSSWSNGWTSSC